jgi:hypothetical protein
MRAILEFNPHKNIKGQIGAMLKKGYLKLNSGKIVWPDGKIVTDNDGKNVDSKEFKSAVNDSLKSAAQSKENKDEVNASLSKYGVKANDLDISIDDDGNVKTSVTISGDSIKELDDLNVDLSNSDVKISKTKDGYRFDCVNSDDEYDTDKGKTKKDYRDDRNYRDSRYDDDHDKKSGDGVLNLVGGIFGNTLKLIATVLDKAVQVVSVGSSYEVESQTPIN